MLQNKQSMYGKLMYIYLSNQYISSLTYVMSIPTQLQVPGICWCVSVSTIIFFDTNKTGSHGITEIFLLVAFFNRYSNAVFVDRELKISLLLQYVELCVFILKLFYLLKNTYIDYSLSILMTNYCFLSDCSILKLNLNWVQFIWILRMEKPFSVLVFTDQWVLA